MTPAGTTPDEPVMAKYDLRMRSLDHERPFYTCCYGDCARIAVWSLWLHTPEWGSCGGATHVRCHGHAISLLDRTRHEKHRESKP